jgi:hypothetical protein
VLNAARLLKFKTDNGFYWYYLSNNLKETINNAQRFGHYMIIDITPSFYHFKANVETKLFYLSVIILQYEYVIEMKLFTLQNKKKQRKTKTNKKTLFS